MKFLLLSTITIQMFSCASKQSGSSLFVDDAPFEVERSYGLNEKLESAGVGSTIPGLRRDQTRANAESIQQYKDGKSYGLPPTVYYSNTRDDIGLKYVSEDGTAQQMPGEISNKLRKATDDFLTFDKIQLNGKVDNSQDGLATSFSDYEFRNRAVQGKLKRHLGASIAGDLGVQPEWANNIVDSYVSQRATQYYNRAQTRSNTGRNAAASQSAWSEFKLRAQSWR